MTKKLPEKSPFRSKFEEDIYNNVLANGLQVQYESERLTYLMKGNYTPDFILPNGIIVEAKGYFDARARAKMIAVKKANPTKDIRMLFMNSRNRVHKSSMLTYGAWCEKYGFPYADGMIPLAWFSEEGPTDDE